jgi:hypothetical protein
LTFGRKRFIIKQVSERKTTKMTTKMTTRFILTWHDLGADNFAEREFFNEKGKDHSGSMAALNLASIIDGHCWPWKIEKVLPEGGKKLTSHGRGGAAL